MDPFVPGMLLVASPRLEDPNFARTDPGVGVTGVLCFSGSIYLQVLEGGRSQVSTLYNHDRVLTFMRSNLMSTSDCSTVCEMSN